MILKAFPFTSGGEVTLLQTRGGKSGGMNGGTTAGGMSGEMTSGGMMSGEKKGGEGQALAEVFFLFFKWNQRS